jgi:type VI secretion system secreted protein Hcp
MTRVRLLGALATAMVVTAGPAFAEGPPTTAGAAAAPAATQAVTAPPTGGRATAFLKIDGPQGMVQGESTDKGHAGWIELSSFQMGVSRGTTQAGAGAGSGAGRVSVSEIVITKTTDKASPLLKTAFATGTHFKDAIIELAKPSSDGHTIVYYRVTLSDAFISADRVGTSGGDRPTESVTFNFTKIAYEYTQQKPDGSAGSYTPVQEGYDVKTNIKL